MPPPNPISMPNPFTMLCPIERGTITKARGKVHGMTIIVKPAAKLNKYHPIPTGAALPAMKNQNTPKTINARIPTAVSASMVFNLLAACSMFLKRHQENRERCAQNGDVAKRNEVYTHKEKNQHHLNSREKGRNAHQSSWKKPGQKRQAQQKLSSPLYAQIPVHGRKHLESCLGKPRGYKSVPMLRSAQKINAGVEIHHPKRAAQCPDGLCLPENFHCCESSCSFFTNFLPSNPPVAQSSPFRIIPGEAIIMYFCAISCPCEVVTSTFLYFTLGQSFSTECQNSSNWRHIWHPGEESSSRVTGFI